jgi:hypothetical protein
MAVETSWQGAESSGIAAVAGRDELVAGMPEMYAKGVPQYRRAIAIATVLYRADGMYRFVIH